MKGDVTELLSMISTMLEEGIQPGYHSPLHMCPLAWRVTEEDEKVKAEKIVRAVTINMLIIQFYFSIQVFHL